MLDHTTGRPGLLGRDRDDLLPLSLTQVMASTGIATTPGDRESRGQHDRRYPLSISDFAGVCRDLTD